MTDPDEPIQLGTDPVLPADDDASEWRDAVPGITEAEAVALGGIEVIPWVDFTAQQLLDAYRAGVAARPVAVPPSVVPPSVVPQTARPDRDILGVVAAGRVAWGPVPSVPSETWSVDGGAVTGKMIRMLDWAVLSGLVVLTAADPARPAAPRPAQLTAAGRTVLSELASPDQLLIRWQNLTDDQQGQVLDVLTHRQPDAFRHALDLEERTRP